MAPLLQRRDPSGEDLIPVVFELSRVQDHVDRLHRVFERIGQAQGGAAPEPRQLLDAVIGNLQSLSQQVAKSTSKQVRLITQISSDALPDDVTRVLREASPQLVRNAVVHGIELPDERQSQGKPPVGELRLEIGRRHDGQIEVTLSDDGRGIEVPAVRYRMTQMGSDATKFSDSQVLGFIFHPNFTTATEVTEHAGRGVGLALVRQIAEKAGA